MLSLDCEKKFIKYKEVPSDLVIGKEHVHLLESYKKKATTDLLYLRYT